MYFFVTTQNTRFVPRNRRQVNSSERHGQFSFPVRCTLLFTRHTRHTCTRHIPNGAITIGTWVPCVSEPYDDVRALRAAAVSKHPRDGIEPKQLFIFVTLNTYNGTRYILLTIIQIIIITTCPNKDAIRAF